MKGSIEYLSQFDVLQIRTRLDARLHTSFKTMNASSLQAAIAAPRQAFFGQEMYPTVWDKAAALLHALIRNHPFVDGNKRIAWLAVTEFFQRNGYALRADAAEAAGFTKQIAQGHVEPQAISAWLRERAEGRS